MTNTLVKYDSNGKPRSRGFTDREKVFLQNLKTMEPVDAAKAAGYSSSLSKHAMDGIIGRMIKANPKYMYEVLGRLGYSESQFATLLAKAVGIPTANIPQISSYQEALNRIQATRDGRRVMDVVAETHIDTLGATRQRDGKDIPDYPTRLSAVQLFLKATGNLAPEQIELRGKILHGHMMIPQQIQDALRKSTDFVYGRYMAGCTIEDILEEDVIDVEFEEEKQ